MFLPGKSRRRGASSSIDDIDQDPPGAGPKVMDTSGAELEAEAAGPTDAKRPRLSSVGVTGGGAGGGLGASKGATGREGENMRQQTSLRQGEILT